MDTLDASEWDVLIAGTGIQQSLLALSLSRSDKKVLHIDKNEYYGGAEAAFSLQEVDSWVEKLRKDEATTSLFANALITKPETSDEDNGPKLSFPRAYSLALAPQLIYTDSKLLPSLVNSKTYRQLEFVAMGSWFVYDRGHDNEQRDASQGTLQRIPTTREDLVFSDKSIDIRSKRAVMKVLRFLVEFETHEDVWKPYAEKPLHEFLTAHFKLPNRLHGLFSALTLSLDRPEDTSTGFALPRIARHLRTTGLFGPGFNSVIPKWGGLSEIAQVACRAGAVGGAVYVLNRGLKDILHAQAESNSAKPLSVTLSDDDTIKTSWVVGTEENISLSKPLKSARTESKILRRSVTVLSSALPSLFPALAEGAPPPAGAVVVFPALTFAVDSLPVYLIVHSSDTGECPQGQSVVYATTHGPSELLNQAVERLKSLLAESPPPLSLYALNYEQRDTPAVATSVQNQYDEQTITFPQLSNDLAFDESVLDNVRAAWQKIMGTSAKAEEFLKFEDRNPMADEEDDD